MKKTLIKGQQRKVVEYTSKGTAIFTSDFYLTAYKSYGCKSVMEVTLETADEIINRLFRKGFILA